jgi:hypothetical protein
MAETTKEVLMGKSEWHHNAEDKTEEIAGLDCSLCIQRRPAYCDRGNFVVTIEYVPKYDRRRFSLDWADGWPRYYMDLDRAKLEIKDWMKKRKQWIP